VVLPGVAHFFGVFLAGCLVLACAIGDYLAVETSEGLVLDSTHWGTVPLGASLSLDPDFYEASMNDDSR